jgi:hypothetical protein
MNLFSKMLDDILGEVAAADAREAERRARRFLATLDPDSTEGMWFDALAERFPTRLQAAIVYVRDVKQSP